MSSGSLKKESELWPRARTHTQVSAWLLLSAKRRPELVCSERVGVGFCTAPSPSALLLAADSLNFVWIQKKKQKPKPQIRGKNNRGKKKKGKNQTCCRVPKSTNTTSGVGRFEATDGWKAGEPPVPAEAAQRAHPVWRCSPGCWHRWPFSPAQSCHPATGSSPQLGPVRPWRAQCHPKTGLQGTRTCFADHRPL